MDLAAAEISELDALGVVVVGYDRFNDNFPPSEFTEVECQGISDFKSMERLPCFAVYDFQVRHASVRLRGKGGH